MRTRTSPKPAGAQRLRVFLGGVGAEAKPGPGFQLSNDLLIGSKPIADRDDFGDDRPIRGLGKTDADGQQQANGGNQHAERLAVHRDHARPQR